MSCRRQWRSKITFFISYGRVATLSSVFGDFTASLVVLFLFFRSHDVKVAFDSPTITLSLFFLSSRHSLIAKASPFNNLITSLYELKAVFKSVVVVVLEAMVVQHFSRSRPAVVQHHGQLPRST